jgi:hypothetical protein
MFTVKMLAITLAVAAGSMAGSAAYAGPKGHDMFSTTTGAPPSQPHISGNAAFGNNSPVARWFDAVDEAVISHTPGWSEKLVLKKEFKGDQNKVIEWSNTAAKVARQYRDLARILRAMPTPSNLGPASSTLRDYKVATADWYDDSAELFEDWIRPRQAAVTREELDEQINQMQQRSANLVRMNEDLQVMDKELRTQFDVRDRNDALARYVTKPLKNNN